MKVLTMTSKTMVDDLLPLLIERFCFQNRSSPDQISFNSSENYILMKTGGGGECGSDSLVECAWKCVHMYLRVCTYVRTCCVKKL